MFRVCFTTISIQKYQFNLKTGKVNLKNWTNPKKKKKKNT